MCNYLWVTPGHMNYFTYIGLKTECILSDNRQYKILTNPCRRSLMMSSQNFSHDAAKVVCGQYVFGLVGSFMNYVMKVHKIILDHFIFPEHRNSDT